MFSEIHTLNIWNLQVWEVQ